MEEKANGRTYEPLGSVWYGDDATLLERMLSSYRVSAQADS